MQLFYLFADQFSRISQFCSLAQFFRLFPVFRGTTPCSCEGERIGLLFCSFPRQLTFHNRSLNFPQSPCKTKKWRNKKILSDMNFWHHCSAVLIPCYPSSSLAFLRVFHLHSPCCSFWLFSTATHCSDPPSFSSPKRQTPDRTEQASPTNLRSPTDKPAVATGSVGTH